MAGTSDLDRQIEQLRRCEYIKEAEVKALCAKAREILVEESNVQPVQAPVTVCGDIHGQFYDLLELFKVGEEVPATSYVFMVIRFATQVCSRGITVTSHAPGVRAARGC